MSCSTRGTVLSSGSLQEMINAAEIKSRKDDKMARYVFNMSWAANILLLIAKIFALFQSNYSKSVAASLADSAVDVLSQVVLALSQYYIDRPSKSYPVGRARLEALGVICCSCIMSMSSFEVVQFSLSDLYKGFFEGCYPSINADERLYIILGVGTSFKFILWIICMSMDSRSDTMVALAEDHLNDVVSNIAAVITAGVATEKSKLWWVDGVGAIIISFWIIGRWVDMTLEQVEKVVGKTAPNEFIDLLEQIARDHHECIEVDCTRAYHFGSCFMVEMEIIMPSTMTLTLTHDISLELQHKLEALTEVERAFVHVDYQRRDYPEHKVERKLLEASENSDENSPLISWPLSSRGAGKSNFGISSPPV